MKSLFKKGFFLANTAIFGYLGYQFYQNQQLPPSPLSLKNTALENYQKPGAHYNFKSREQHINEMLKTQYDVLVIGGGCNGAGVLLDASSRGLKCALVEANDFAAGTSSKATKLIHGGIRYLYEVFELDIRKGRRIEKLKLVVEALKERNYFLENAYYMNRPLPMVFPSDSFFWAAFYYSGVLVYHLLYLMTKDKNDTRYTFPAPFWMNANEMQQAFPLLDKKYQYGVAYYDGQFNDSRMDVELLLTSTLDNYIQGMKGANIANYMEVVGILKDKDGQACGVKVRDKTTDKTYEIKSNVVVNCAGAFADQIRFMDNQKAGKRILCVGGSHLILNKKFGNSKLGIVIPETLDSRILFVLPWLGQVVVGTTEKRLDEPVLDPTVSFDETIFMVKELDRIYPGLEVTNISSNVLSKYSGVRPLILETAQTDKNMQTRSIARKHIIEKSDSGLFSLMGGKWTIYRLMGEETVDQIVDHLKQKKLLKSDVAPASKTKQLRLSGEFNKNSNSVQPERSKYLQYFSKQLEEKFNIDHKVAKYFIKSYGDRSVDILKLIKDDPSLKEKIHPRHNILKAEIVYHIRSEMAMKPIDVMCRRTRLAFLDQDALYQSAPTVVDIFAKEFKWKPQQRDLILNETIENLKKLEF